MAPIKFEEHIKDKLEKRTIESSDNAWNKLSEKLDEQEGNSNRKFIWWIGIAASLVGVFLVTTMFFNNNENETVSPVLVETPINEVIKTQQEHFAEDVVAEHEKLSQKEIEVFPESDNNNAVVQEVVKKSKIKSEEVFANNIKETSPVEDENPIISYAIVNKETNQEIVAQITEPEKSKIHVTDSEIESLLNSAQKDIASSKIITKKANTVDANSLLQVVETDLEQSFRDKMFNTIISSYNTVKTAVVERND